MTIFSYTRRKQDACWPPRVGAATFTESTSGTVCSRLEERVLRRGLKLEFESRDVARREADAEVFGDLRVVEEDEQFEGLEDGLVVDELLREETRGREHREAAVLQLLRLHLSEGFRVRGLRPSGSKPTSPG